MKTIEQVIEQLDAKIPRDAVSLRDSGMGKKLSYLEGHYVIARLNEIFGAQNWEKKVELTQTFNGMVNDKHYVSYMAKVTLTVRFPDATTKTTEDVGFGDGQDARNPGKTHELAIKEAVTDGLKRCAKDLGMSMGLALYDKSQENVEDAEPIKPPTPRPAPTPAVATPTVAKAVLAETKPAVGTNEEAVKSAIKNAVRVLDAQKKVSISVFKKLLVDNYKVDKVDMLTSTQIAEVLAGLKKDYPELKLA